MAQKEPDELIVQVAVTINLPHGAKVSKKALQEILDRLAADRPLPKNVTVRGIFWRNPERRGGAGDWRTHFDYDPKALPGRLAPGYPKESLQEVLSGGTLSAALQSGIVTF